MVGPAGLLGQHSVSARPRPDESLVGYIFRLAHRRRLPSAWELARRTGFDRFTNRPARRWLEALATSAEVAVDELDAIAYGPPGDAVGWFRGVELPTNMFDRRGGADRRLCPLCLGEHGHHRAIWDLMCIAVCPVHAVRLADACRTCGNVLQWTGADLTRCTCMADLTNMDAEHLPDMALRGTRVVHGLLGDDRFAPDAAFARSLPPFQDMTPGSIVEFLFRAGLELVAGRRKVFSSEQPGELAWEAHVALNRGLEVAEGWPRAFFKLLEMMHERSGKRLSVALLGSAGAVERWLAGLPEGAGVAIRLAVAEFRVQMQTKRSGEDQPL